VTAVAVAAAAVVACVNQVASAVHDLEEEEAATAVDDSTGEVGSRILDASSAEDLVLVEDTALVKYQVDDAGMDCDSKEQRAVAWGKKRTAADELDLVRRTVRQTRARGRRLVEDPGSLPRCQVESSTPQSVESRAVVEADLALLRSVNKRSDSKNPSALVVVVVVVVDGCRAVRPPRFSPCCSRPPHETFSSVRCPACAWSCCRSALPVHYVSCDRSHWDPESRSHR
jgi:hypothetical protein